MNTKAGIDMHHLSTEKECFPLSIDIFDFESKYGGRKSYLKRSGFFIVHISTNSALDGLKFWMHVPNIHFEGTLSQIVVLGLSFHFMSKNG